MRTFSGRTRIEGAPQFSPDGRHLAHWYPRDGETKNVGEIYVGPAAGGDTTSITRPLDRNVARGIWMPDGNSMLVGANDGTTTALWIQPIDRGKARRIDMGKVVATAPFWLDASVGPKGEIAVTGSEPGRPAEMYYLASPDAKLQRMTDFNRETGALDLGKSETIQWDCDAFHMDGVVTYPPGSRPQPGNILWCSIFMEARVRHRRRPFQAVHSFWRRRGGLCSSQTIAAAIIWAMHFKPASGMTPAKGRVAT